ncbi:MAG: CopD family protein [Candidatus Krumholzibacteriia bacterium]
MYTYLLILHVLGASVWTGGHLVLVIGFLPRALRNQDPALITGFESRFERVGIPALISQVVTGLWLAYIRVPDVSQWLTFNTYQSTLISLKLVLLLVTLGLAAHARVRIIPRLDANRMRELAFHMITVTVLAVLFVVLGVGYRTGGVL